jgi:3-oxoacyl-[acyl-carrier protein] reductase
VEVLTRTVAKELGAKGIRVNAIAPGIIPTDMANTIPRELIQGITDQTPLGRVGTPEEVANTVAFLAGPQASWVNGQVIEIAGGI